MILAKIFEIWYKKQKQLIGWTSSKLNIFVLQNILLRKWKGKSQEEENICKTYPTKDLYLDSNKKILSGQNFWTDTSRKIYSK